MSLENTLNDRSHSKCELCTNTESLSSFEVGPDSNGSADMAVLVCGKCNEQISTADDLDVNHWRCLNDSMWSEFPPVQVMAFRMLSRLRSESWASDLLEQLYLDDENLKWAEAGLPKDDEVKAFDSNGAQLLAGDSVTLIKDLDVKGAGFTAKRGTKVQNITLTDNPEHIEGRVNGTRIVLVTKFLKKT